MACLDTDQTGRRQSGKDGQGVSAWTSDRKINPAATPLSAHERAPAASRARAHVRICCLMFISPPPPLKSRRCSAFFWCVYSLTTWQSSARTEIRQYDAAELVFKACVRIAQRGTGCCRTRDRAGPEVRTGSLCRRRIKPDWWWVRKPGLAQGSVRCGRRPTPRRRPHNLVLRKSPSLLTAALKHRPTAVMLSFADPRPCVDAIHGADAVMICQCRNIAHVQDAVDVGAGVVVAQ